MQGHPDSAGRTESMAVESYEISLGKLEGSITEASLLCVLLARDRVLDAAPEPLDADLHARLRAIDQRLRGQTRKIVAAITPGSFAAWRQTFLPKEELWWWWLDQEAEGAGILWLILSTVLLPVSLTLAVDTSKRFLSGGPGPIDIFGTVLQVSLALILTGGLLTGGGRRWLERRLQELGITTHSRARLRGVASLAIFAVLLIINISLPRLAAKYVNRGIEHRRAGRVTQAIELYRRALSLDPRSHHAHYNLAWIAAGIGDHDQAISEYRQALASKSCFLPAYNNLAHLYITRGEYRSALLLLQQAIVISSSPDDCSDDIADLDIDPGAPPLAYFLWRNRGWAHVGLGHLAVAEEDLERSLTYYREGVTAHCLLGRIWHERRNEDTALKHWRSCVAQPAAGEAREPALRAEAENQILLASIDAPSRGEGE